MADEKFTHVEDTWDNERGNKLWTQAWIPKGEPVAMMFMCHGYADHLHGPLKDHAEKFAQAGFATFGLDYEGCGKSTGVRVYHPSFEGVVDDAFNFFKSKRSMYPKLKAFMYGESMGGCVSLNISLKYEGFFDGVVLIAPMVKISEEQKPPSFVVTLLTALASTFPQAPLVPMPDIIDRAFKTEEARRRIRQSDFFYNKKARLMTALQLLRASEDLHARLEDIKIPFLVVHGDADIVTDPEASRDLHKRASSTDKTINIYEGMWHALLSGETEEDSAKVFSDILSWLKARA